MLRRKSVLLGLLTSGFVIAHAARPSDAIAGGTVKPIAPTQPASVPRWTSNTTYSLGQQVISPNNDVTSAKVAHTSSATYASDTLKWALSSTYAPQAGPKFTVSDSGLFVSTTGNDANDGLSPGAAKATVAAAAAALPGRKGLLNVMGGSHTVNGLTLTDGLRIQGFGHRATILASTGDVFTLTSGLAQDVVIRDVSIYAGGSAFKISSGGMFALSTIEDVYLAQTTGTAPIIDACGLIDTKWRIHAEGHAGATAPLIRLKALVNNVDAIACNSFTGRSTHSSSYVFDIEDATGGSYAENNRIHDWNFEQPNSGAVKILSGVGNVIDNSGIYDLSAAVTVPLVYVAKSSASARLSMGNRISFQRHGGSLGAGGYDVQLVNGEAVQTTLIDCWADNGGLVVDWGGTLATVVNIDMMTSINAALVQGLSRYGTKFIHENPGNIISAAAAGAGVGMVNPATHKLLISDGANWRDAMGTIV